ncbi:MerR family transcriptional regulator [Sphingopyxis sp.]|uniref:MerR family transcriptional regulator n=1 Tax=Sphingopyxis sp. TaxID=1908224 RepID=UPI0025F2E9AC|nr:MerR family transcriptional regulator [Sphingopyxis sp.]MBK6414734.1 MerR family transcriptional regulator [Sphingopyxis sp.]
MTREGFAIGALSQQCGCNIETIRYYERIGLIPRAERRGRYRYYTSEDADRLRFIKRARALGFAIEEIRDLLRLTKSGLEDGVDACADAKAIAQSNLDIVKARLEDLKRMEAALTDAIGACDRDSFRGCPILATLSGTYKTVDGRIVP